MRGLIPNVDVFRFLPIVGKARDPLPSRVYNSSLNGAP